MYANTAAEDRANEVDNLKQTLEQFARISDIVECIEQEFLDNTHAR